METNNDILKKFKIKPVSIKLDKVTFKKIRMRCTATSSDHEKLTCIIKQEFANTFSIKINRLKMDSFLGTHFYMYIYIIIPISVIKRTNIFSFSIY